MTSAYLSMLHTQQMISEQLLSNLYRDIPQCPIDKELHPSLQAMKSLFKPILPNSNDDDDDYDDYDDEKDDTTKGFYFYFYFNLFFFYREIKLLEKIILKWNSKFKILNSIDIVLLLL